MYTCILKWKNKKLVCFFNNTKIAAEIYQKIFEKNMFIHVYDSINCSLIIAVGYVSQKQFNTSK